MPTVLELGWGRIKVSIYFKDHNPPHVHVTAPGAEAVFEIDSLECIRSDGFSESALGKIERALAERRNFLKEKWDEHQE